ncbi:MAG: carbohydrate-binding protein, partial [Pedobacter sp.]
LRGIGITKATTPIQIDRYSNISAGAAVAFLDTSNRFDGWKASFAAKDASIQYNTVDFGKQAPTRLLARITGDKGAVIHIHADNKSGPLIAILTCDGENWKVTQTRVLKTIKGMHHLVLINANDKKAEIDWLRFE